ncbi:MAG TPA: M48 family metallopeptidase [Patescibacteria group bacterium]|nr:M48 family metallopeptidase [Patescibacteria group bacterium]
MKDNKKIKYKIINSYKAKHLRLALYLDKSIVITKPFLCSQKTAEKFINSKKNWIEKKLQHFDKLPQKRKFSREHYLKNKESARKIIKNKVDKYSKELALDYRKISIRDQKTRWGSCSKDANLNFNYKIILLPEHLQDYIIIHELCHLQELNHSKKFWDLVATICPDYKKHRRELKNTNF